MYRFLSFALLLTLLMGCAKDPPYVNISHAPVSILPSDYPKLLKRWTRKRVIVHKLDTPLNVHATLLSWEFRWAYIVKYTSLYGLGAAQRKRLWTVQEEDLKEGVQFVVAVACTDSKWNDLEKGDPVSMGPGKSAKGSTWRITLTVDKGEPVVPKEVVAVEPLKKIHKDMFPFLGHFHRLYRVTFPAIHKGKRVLPGNARRLELRFAGPLGKASLQWLTTNSIISKE